MSNLKLYLQEFTSEPNVLSVIINCGPKHPGELEDIQPGHQIFDFARKILEGKLMENQWITTDGDPNECDLDFRSMIGRNDDEDADYVYCLACLRFPKGTVDEGGVSFRKLAPDEQADDTDGFKFNEPGEMPEPDLVVPAEDDMDTKGKYTLEDLLGGL